jgi:hypothetical protein
MSDPSLSVISSAELKIPIKTFGEDVLFSGFCHAEAEGEITFTISAIAVTIRFKSDSDKQRIETEAEGEKTLIIKAYNFSNNLGTGLLKPIRIGTYKGRHLSLLFSVASYNKESPKLVTYTFLVGGQVDGN